MNDRRRVMGWEQVRGEGTKPAPPSSRSQIVRLSERRQVPVEVREVKRTNCRPERHEHLTSLRLQSLAPGPFPPFLGPVRPLLPPPHMQPEGRASGLGQEAGRRAAGLAVPCLRRRCRCREPGRTPDVFRGRNYEPRRRLQRA